MSTGRMTAVMDDLAADARSARDGVFNTLDAVARQSRAAHGALVERVRGLALGSEPAPPADAEAAGPERDTRFDPEDEWDLPVRSDKPATGDPSTASHLPRSEDEDDNGDYPPTWLR